MAHSTVVTIKLNVAVKDKLQHLSKIKSRSPHWLMKKAIDTYIENEEIKELLKQETLARWEEAELQKFVSHDKVINWLDSWGEKNAKERP